MLLKAGSVALAIALAAVAAPFGFAQIPEQRRMEYPQNAESARLAREVIEGALRDSRVAEISSDLRRTFREVHLPLLRDAVQGDLPGAPAPDAETAAIMAKGLTLLDYARRTGDELDVALTKNREAMISEAAAVIAKTSTTSQIKDAGEVMNLPAVRKSFDAFYAMTKLITGFTYQESRSFYEFSAWAESVQLGLPEAAPGGVHGKPQPVPSPKKIAKAQAVVSDLMRISQLDEMVADAKRFAREVYVETAPMSDEERQELREQIDQWEFAYNLQKTMALSAAPSMVASALTDEQLATLHNFILSPGVAKLFAVFRDIVKTGTAFTKGDVLGAQRSIEQIQQKSQTAEKSLEQRDRNRDEWSAYFDKWTDIIENSISPDTRSGLKRSFEEFQSTGVPM